jgi:hypothetical protein
MTRTLVLLVLGFTCIAGVISCVSSSKTHLIPQAASATDHDSTTLTVQNDGFPDMDMYILRQDGTRYRLGTALGNTTTVLLIPQYMLIGAATDLRFIGNPIGGQRAAVSQTISVSPGDDVSMIIPPG